MLNNPFDQKMMLEDYNQEQDDIIKKKNELKVKLSNLYKEAFKSQAAIEILEDLENNFLNHPSYLPGWNLNDVCYLEGQKSVVNYIKQQIEYKHAN